MSQHQLVRYFNEFVTSGPIELLENIGSCSYLQYVILATVLCGLIYFFVFLFTPMNWIYGIDEAGWLSKQDYKKNKRHRRLGNLPPVYPNGWFALAESSRLKKEDVLHVTALGENFAVFRTKSGNAVVLDAYCPHLGANMAVGGKVRDDCLECPFHLLKFNEDGECTDPKVTIPKSAKVKKWISCEVNDFIFVWYHAEGEEPKWYPSSVEGFREFSYSGRNEFQVSCHIQEIPENGSDITHFKALHEALALSGGDLRTHENPSMQFCRHEWLSKWEAGTEDERHIGKASLRHNIVLFGKLRLAYCYIDIKQMGPGYVVLKFSTSIGPLILLQTVTPIEPLLQLVIHRIYSPRYLFLCSRFILLSECFMFKRDMMIWNNKKYLDKPVFTKYDSSIAKYRRWFGQFYSEHSPTYRSATQGYDW